ncbi:MAG: BrnA antitoxin family protein [Terricaulis sp.]
MTAKKSASRALARSGAKPASSSIRGVQEESASSAFAMPLLKSGGRTSKRKVIDPDNPPLTAEQLKRLRPISEEEKQFWRKALGRPPSESPKQAVSIRLDGEVIAHFKQAGPGWQSRINAALRKAAKLGRK